MADSIEQQALDRVARMYSSFDRRPSRSREQAQTEAPPAQKAGEPQPTPEPPQKQEPVSRTDFLSSLMEDKEQSLLLLLLLILMKDGADLNLILALMYIII